MTWRTPQYATLHAIRAAAGVGLTTSATVDSDFPIANLWNDRPSVPFKWSSSAADHYIQYDTQAGGSATWDSSRLYIPAGHTVTSGNLKVEGDDDVAFGTPTTLLAATAVSGLLDTRGAINTEFTLSTERYVRVTFSGTGAWTIPECWFTATLTTTDGPEPEWTDEPRSNVQQFDGGDTLQDDADQQFIEYEYAASGLVAAADLTTLETLVNDVSTFLPFIVDTAYADGASGGKTYIVKLERDSRQRQATEVPASHDRTKRITLSMLESLL